MANAPPQQEIRFAVVLYGGASLAIYINGVAQELLRMVRSTAQGATNLSSTENIYRRIGALMALDRRPGDDVPEADGDVAPKSRFVVDIISGTSAGGINGVALAKSLALKCPDMSALEETWLKKAQIDALFNTAALGKTTSLLNSGYMYDIIHETLSAMNAGADPSAGAFADQIDLFVTATDLNGLYEPLQLADGIVDERVHKTVFRFSYVSEDYSQTHSDIAKNDFTPEYDPMLSFAARCTSSFPLAFEPMCFDAIGGQIGYWERDRIKSKEKFERFFPEYAAQGLGFFPKPTDPSTDPDPDTKKLALGERVFADGGYLDNRPFSYAIDLIQYRSSSTPVQRKLLFVDPFPEYRADSEARESIDFIENTKLALMTLPRYETIRGDIDRINDNNRRQTRLNLLRQELESYTDDPVVQVSQAFGMGDGVGRESQPGIGSVVPQLDDETLRSTTVSRLIATHGYSESYRPYHVLRKQSTTMDIAALLTESLGYRPDGDEAYFILLLLHSWRTANYVDTDAAILKRGLELGPSIELENAYLLDFDIEFERRRINDLITSIDRSLFPLSTPLEDDLLAGIPANEVADLRAALTRQLTVLTKARRDAFERAKALTAPLKAPLNASFRDLMRQRFSRARIAIADKAYAKEKDQIDAVMGAVKAEYGTALAAVRTAMRALLARRAKLLARYQTFQWHDAISLPFLDGSDSKEHTQIEVYRVSPADTALFPKSVDRPDKKLAGTALAAFGAFLQESWRQNDIMWGRLDGAERIITALLPDDDDAVLRFQFINEAQDQILSETIGAQNSEMFFKWLVHRLTNETAHQKTPEEILRWAREFFPKSGKVIGADKLADFIKDMYEVPPPPAPEKAIGWTHQALGILGKMVDGLGSDSSGAPAIKIAVAKRLGGVLRMSALLLTQVLAFAVPDKVGFHMLRRWLPILALAGALMVAAGTIWNVPGAQLVGVATLFASFLIWVAQQALLRFLRRDSGAGLFLTVFFALVFGLIPWLVGAFFFYDRYALWLHTQVLQVLIPLYVQPVVGGWAKVVTFSILLGTFALLICGYAAAAGYLPELWRRIRGREL